MTEEQKQWIDEASYEDLLRRWRFHPLGDPYFLDECGKYYSEVMIRKGDELTPDERINVSKRIGWHATKTHFSR